MGILDHNMQSFEFDLPKNKSSAIKVIGVGGGGGNAANHMYNMGITGVDFVICNTDAQALINSPIPTKIQLGASTTEGLGAGSNPEIGEKAAIESLEEVKSLLNTNTKMVFITAGMGGGTGTGAAPIIAACAKELDILTVAIVTVPFFFEGKVRLEQAEKGLEKLRQSVDSLIVINNDKLRELYGNLGYKAGFAKADEVLTTAAKGIAEVITQNYTINIDLRDAKTVLANSGTAIMGSGIASGENKAKEAIMNAMDSPLLNDNKITGAKNVLLLILSGNEEITIDEIGVINDYIQNEAGYSANIIMGVGEDPELGDAISVTVVATGFPQDEQKYTGKEQNKIIHTLREDQPITKSIHVDSNDSFSISAHNPKKFILEDEDEPFTHRISSKPNEPTFNLRQDENELYEFKVTEGTEKEQKPAILNEMFQQEEIIESKLNMKEEEEEEETIIFSLDDDSSEDKVVSNISMIEDRPIQIDLFNETENEEIKKTLEEKRERFKKFQSITNMSIEETERIPAYKRAGIDLEENNKQTQNISKFYLDDIEEGEIKPNGFLNDNVD